MIVKDLRQVCKTLAGDSICERRHRPRVPSQLEAGLLIHISTRHVIATVSANFGIIPRRDPTIYSAISARHTEKISLSWSKAVVVGERVDDWERQLATSPAPLLS
jgi:hypothetical protein